MRVPVRRAPETRVSEQQLGYARAVAPLNVSPLTEVVEGFRNQLLDEQDARQRVDLNRRLIEEVNGLQSDFVERQRNPEISPIDFANSTNTAYTERHTALLNELRQGNYSEELLGDFETRLATVRQGFFERGLAHQVAQLSSRAVEEVEDLGVAASQYAANNPNDYATARDMVRDSVRTQPDLTEDQRSELEDQQLAIVRDAGMRAFAIQHPQAVIDTFDPQGLTAPTPATSGATPTAASGWQGVATSVATELGLNPVEVAAVMSYETAGTFSPTRMGGRGNNYMGLIQFGPEERQRYGITENSTPAQWSTAILGFMRDRGFRRGMSLLDFYSTINAGRPGRPDASDGPGNTVRSHLDRALREHRGNAERWLGTAAPIQTAAVQPTDLPSSQVQQRSDVRVSYGPAGNLDPVLADVGNMYPRLRQYLDQVTVMHGSSEDGRQLEFYPPNERDNPAPGRLTLEIFNSRLQGRDLSESIGLDLLHHLGGQNPDGTPVDPEYMALKQQMVNAIRHANRPMDQEAYQSERRAGLAEGTYDDWLNNNRADAYIRGIVSPRMNSEWQRPGTYTPEMQRVGDQIKALLQHGPLEGIQGAAAPTTVVASIRTGNPLLDDLNGRERLQLLGLAREQLNRVTVTQRAQMDVTIGNITAEAMNNGGEIATPIPSEQDVLRVYGAVEGPQRWAQIQQSRSTGRAITTFRTQSATDIQRSLTALRPVPGSPTYATQLQIYENAQRAAQALLTEREHDPAGYVMQYFPAVRAAAQQGTDHYYAALDRAYQTLGIDTRTAPLMTTQAREQLTEQYRTMSPSQRREFMRQNWSMGEDRFRRFVHGMEGTTAEVDARIFALLRTYPQGAGPIGSIYQDILIGRDAIAQDPARRPRSEEVTQLFRTEGLSAVLNLDANVSRAIQEAAEGLYVQRGGNNSAGAINRTLYKQALATVLGGNLPVNMSHGQARFRTILPPGTSRQQFQGFIERQTMESISSLSVERRPPRYGDLRTPVPISDIIDEGVFVMTSPGRYMIRMGSDGRPLMTSTGRPFLVNIHRRDVVRAPVVGRAPSVGMRGGVM